MAPGLRMRCSCVDADAAAAAGAATLGPRTQPWAARVRRVARVAGGAVAHLTLLID